MGQVVKKGLLQGCDTLDVLMYFFIISKAVDISFLQHILNFIETQVHFLDCWSLGTKSCLFIIKGVIRKIIFQIVFTIYNYGIFIKKL